MKTILSTGVNPKQIMIDDEDYPYLSQFRWKLQNGNRPFRKEKKTCKSIYLYREIMKCPAGLVIDHIDHDPMNNQKSNLRICTKGENNMNRLSSSPRGVGWHKKNKKWQARIGTKGKQLFLGMFDTQKEAAIAYNIASLKYYGDTIYLNEI